MNSVFRNSIHILFRVSSCEFVVPALSRLGTGTTKSHEMTRTRKSFAAALAVALILAQTLAITASPSPLVPSSQTNQKLEPSEKSWKFADKQLKKMSVDEKIGQLVHIGINARFANQESAFFKSLKHDVVDNKIGGVIFFGAPIYETTHLANRLQE